MYLHIWLETVDDGTYHGDGTVGIVAESLEDARGMFEATVREGNRANWEQRRGVMLRKPQSSYAVEWLHFYGNESDIDAYFEHGEYAESYKKTLDSLRLVPPDITIPVGAGVPRGILFRVYGSDC